MSINPKKLRSLAEAGQGAVLIPADASMVADAMEIADSCARADVESYCHAVDEPHVEGDYRAWWWDLERLSEDDRRMVDLSLRYLDARGAIEYRTEGGKRQVRFKERAE